MVANNIRKTIVGVFLIHLLTAPGYAGDLNQTVNIAIFPCTDVVSSFQKFNPLIVYLSEVTQLDCRMVFFQDSDSYERAVKSGELSFVLQDPHVYMNFSDRYQGGSLLRTMTWEGQRTQSGVVIVRKDSAIRKIADLKGKTVMFGPKVSSARWVAAKWLFKENGLDLDTDLKAYSNGRCCEDIAFSVYLKAVDAGVVCDHFLSEHPIKQMELGVDAGQLAVIGTTRPVPTKVFTAIKRVDPEVIARVNTALLRLDSRLQVHQSILNKAELGGFLKTDDRDLDEMKRLLETVTAD